MNLDSITIVKLGGKLLHSTDEQMYKKLSEFCLSRPVLIIHGAGPLIDSMLENQGKDSHFVDGLRYTTKDTADIVDRAQIYMNRAITNNLKRYIDRVVGLTGSEGDTVSAEPISIARYGYVGSPNSVSLDLIEDNLLQGNTVVLSPVPNEKMLGHILNINADQVVPKLVEAAVKKSIKVNSVAFLSDVAGVMDHNQNVIDKLSAKAATELIENKNATEGMAVKIRAAIDSVTAGAERVHIGSSAWLEDKAKGTQITSEYGNHQKVNEVTL